MWLIFCISSIITTLAYYWQSRYPPVQEHCFRRTPTLIASRDCWLFSQELLSFQQLPFLKLIFKKTEWTRTTLMISTLVTCDEGPCSHQPGFATIADTSAIWYYWIKLFIMLLFLRRILHAIDILRNRRGSKKRQKVVLPPISGYHSIWTVAKCHWPLVSHIIELAVFHFRN